MSDPIRPAVIDGITVTKADVLKLRETVIEWRDNSMEQWPGAIPFTVSATFLVAFLQWAADIYPEVR